MRKKTDMLNANSAFNSLEDFHIIEFTNK